jgi:hypothetical protein
LQKKLRGLNKKELMQKQRQKYKGLLKKLQELKRKELPRKQQQ